MNLTRSQILALVICTLGVLTASATQLTDLVGPMATKIIISASTLLMSILSGWVAVLSGQSNQLAEVQAMPGVEKITVNSQANSTLATMAVDPANAKIAATPEAQQAVAATARAAT